MTVFVDSLRVARASGPAFLVGKRNGHLWCHMMADSIEELHAFADRLGLKRRCCHVDHYDLTPGRRKTAVELGAKEVNSRELIRLRRQARISGR